MFFSVSCRLSDTQECLESSLIEKENTLAKTSEKLELISSLRESLSEKETQYKELSDRLLQTEHTVRVVPFPLTDAQLSSMVNSVFFFFSFQLENMIKKGSSSEKQCSELKTEVADLTQKLSVLKEKVCFKNVFTFTEMLHFLSVLYVSVVLHCLKENSGIFMDNKLDWSLNTDALYKKGQSRLFFLIQEILRSYSHQAV